MKNKTNKLNVIFVVIIAVAMGLACGGNQIEEANAKGERANKKLDEVKELLVKTEARNAALFKANVQTMQQLQAYKSNKTGEAKAIVGDYEKAVEMIKEISKDYSEISQMNLSDQYKEYAKLKSEEYAKRAEAIAVRKGNAQAFIEIDDPQTMLAKLDEITGKSDRLLKDAEDMGERARKMAEKYENLFNEA